MSVRRSRGPLEDGLPAAAEPEGEEPLLLVVDDDPSVRRSLSRLARSVGLEVETFGSAEQFLAREKPERPSCLLLDVEMPGRNGLELQRQLAEKRQEQPIVFMTGKGTVPDSVEAMKGGAVDFLLKPFEEEDLLTAVRDALDRDSEWRAERADRHQLQERLATLTATGVRSLVLGSPRELLTGESWRQAGCLLLDVHMPRMSGIELARRLAESGSRKPVILMSAHEEERASTATTSNAVAFLDKPLDERLLLKALRDVLGSRIGLV